MSVLLCSWCGGDTQRIERLSGNEGTIPDLHAVFTMQCCVALRVDRLWAMKIGSSELGWFTIHGSSAAVDWLPFDLRLLEAASLTHVLLKLFVSLCTAVCVVVVTAMEFRLHQLIWLVKIQIVVEIFTRVHTRSFFDILAAILVASSYTENDFEQNAGDCAANERAQPEDPLVVPFAEHKRWSQWARRIQIWHLQIHRQRANNREERNMIRRWEEKREMLKVRIRRRRRRRRIESSATKGRKAAVDQKRNKNTVKDKRNLSISSHPFFSSTSLLDDFSSFFIPVWT